MVLPNFFILGGPKTGTTAIAHYLSSHPQVFMSDPKELHYFNTDHGHRGFFKFEDYAKQFEGVGPHHKVVCEGSVWYLYSKDAVPNIEEETSAPKYLVMVRNPVEMAPSLHEQKVYSGTEDQHDFEMAWSLQDERREGRSIPKNCREVSHHFYKDACSLGAQLAAVYETVPRERVHVIFNDDFRDSPRDVWLDLEAFLALDDDGRADFPPINVAKERRFQWVADATAALGMARQKLGIKPLGTGVLKSIGQMNKRERPRSAMRPETRAMLVDAFRDDIALLSELTGRDLSHWVGAENA